MIGASLATTSVAMASVLSPSLGTSSAAVPSSLMGSMASMGSVVAGSMVSGPLAAAWQFSILGVPARFALPWGLAFLGGVALAALLVVRHLVRRRRDLARHVPDRLTARMAPQSGLARDVTSSLFLFSGLILLSIAAAQPQCGTRSVLTKRYGMDVVIALDASASMFARDVRPSRLERAKLELSELIDRLQGDRVGIVVFAGDAFVQCPLTTDYAAAKMFLRAIDPHQLPQQGTALAPALKVSRALLQAGDRGATGRAVVVVTDGEDHEGAVEDEASRLRAEGVKVFAVGVGSRTGEPIPEIGRDGSVVGYKKDRAGRTVMTRLNEQVLQEIARVTGGRYIHSATGSLGIGEIHEELDRMDKAEFESRITVQYENRFPHFAWPGVLLAGVGAVLGEGRFRRRRELGNVRAGAFDRLDGEESSKGSRPASERNASSLTPVGGAASGSSDRPGIREASATGSSSDSSTSNPESDSTGERRGHG